LTDKTVKLVKDIEFGKIIPRLILDRISFIWKQSGFTSGNLDNRIYELSNIQRVFKGKDKIKAYIYKDLSRHHQRRPRDLGRSSSVLSPR
jgi:hypothetical protein